MSTIVRVENPGISITPEPRTSLPHRMECDSSLWATINMKDVMKLVLLMAVVVGVGLERKKVGASWLYFVLGI